MVNTSLQDYEFAIPPAVGGKYQPYYHVAPGRYTHPLSFFPFYREIPDTANWIMHKSGKIVLAEENLGDGMGLRPIEGDNDFFKNYHEYFKQSALKQSGQTSDFKGTAGMTREWYPKFHEYHAARKRAKEEGISEDRATRGLLQSGILTKYDFANVKSVTRALKTLRTTVKRHIVLDFVDQQTTDKLDVRVDKWTGYDAIHQDLGDWELPRTSKGGYTIDTMTLKKYGWQYAVSEEFLMVDYDQPVQQDHINNMNGQMDRVFNQKAADLINTIATTITFGPWDASTNGLSNRRPQGDIDAALTAIDNTNESTGQIGILSDRSSYNAYDSNTYVTPGGLQNAADKTYSYGNAIIGGISAFPGVRWGVDVMINADEVMFLDKNAIMAVRGPTRNVQWEDIRTGIKGTMFKAFFNVKTWQPTLTRRGLNVIT
ncbi:MAG TPA: hypothetical protein VGE97_03455 [Nitrososphaera sp.]|jgi:hypothetical protein